MFNEMLYEEHTLLVMSVHPFLYQPHVSGGLLYFTLAALLSVRPFIVHMSIHASFPFDNLSMYQWISLKFFICNCSNNISLGIVYGQISIIY